MRHGVGALALTTFRPQAKTRAVNQMSLNGETQGRSKDLPFFFWQARALCV